MDYKRLIRYAMPYKWRFVFAMISMTIYSGVAALLVYLSKIITETVSNLPKNNTSVYLPYSDTKQLLLLVIRLG